MKMFFKNGCLEVVCPVLSLDLNLLLDDMFDWVLL